MFTSNKDNKLNAAKDGMINEGVRGLDAAKQTARVLSDEVCGAPTTTKSDWEDKMQQAGYRAQELIDSSRDSLVHTGQAVKTRIRGNPVQSSLIALGFGYIIGKIFRR